MANMPCMKTLRAAFALLVLLLVTSSLHAQRRDWQAVEQIAPGSVIHVKGRHIYGTTCVFQQATNDALICEPRPELARYGMLRDFRFDRRYIREVRLERSDDTNTAIGALIGAGIGATLGSATPNNGTLTRGGRVLVLGGLGALIGGAFGRTFHALHGQVVYKP